ncbi:hypothetical protein [Streptosporangium longisporum]|uniref:Uncharacterized protein n=1 Tax=Streptosporangium longisporum TaxID=46187 RepID=A0ABP6L327_9ACTN
MNFSTNPTTEAGMTEHTAHTSTTPAAAGTPEAVTKPKTPVDVAEKVTVEVLSANGHMCGMWTWVKQEDGTWSAFQLGQGEWLRELWLDAPSDEVLFGETVRLVRSFGGR